MRKRRDGTAPVDERGEELITQLANLEPQGLDEFRSRWPEFDHYSDDALIRHRDELRTLCGHKGTCIPPDLLEEAESDQEIWDELARWPHSEYSQRLKEEAGEDTEHRLIPTAQFICERWMAAEGANWKQDWSGAKPVITPRKDSLCLRLCLLCVRLHPRVRSCDNPRCEDLPYFVAARNDQRFCSPECAEYGQRVGKLRRWREKRKAELEAAEPGSEGG